MINRAIVEERFILPANLIEDIPNAYDHSFGFNGFGESVYYSAYSRYNEELQMQENWIMTCIRVVEGVISIRKDWYLKNRLEWDKQRWTGIAIEMLTAIYQMKFLPPGRGLWAMGTEHVYKVGSMALNNCGNTHIKIPTFAADFAWSMDALMCGVGVGYKLSYEKFTHENFEGIAPLDYSVPDSREGWVDSTEFAIQKALQGFETHFDYSDVRPYGEKIKGFGGTASGPGPLMILHRRIKAYMNNYRNDFVDFTRLQADIANAIGDCVVSGNVRRSAQMLLGSPYDQTFLELKSKSKMKDNPRLREGIQKCFEISKTDQGSGYQNALGVLWSGGLTDEDFLDDRMQIEHLSNNSEAFEKKEDFYKIPTLSKSIRERGQPGGVNVQNIQKYGRYGETFLRPDLADSCNPCGEIPLEDKELCNLVEIFPTNCDGVSEFIRTARLATIYAQTVSLLMTHSPQTNAVLARNRRIGVSNTGVADWLDKIGGIQLTSNLRLGYTKVVETAAEFARESGVVMPVRHTTLKPSGSISQLAGVSSGMHFPTFSYAFRRLRLSQTSPLSDFLITRGVTYEKDKVSIGTNVFTFPIDQGKTRPATKVSAWEQFAFLAMLQREWSDNMVSCTVYFNRETEGPQVEHMLGQFLPIIKSFSMVPHSGKGDYQQMPYEEIDKETYEREQLAIGTIDFKEYVNTLKADNETNSSLLFCDNDFCETPIP